MTRAVGDGAALSALSFGGGEMPSGDEMAVQSEVDRRWRSMMMGSGA